MQITTLTLGELETNCYLAWCPETLAAVVIDPADSGDTISEEIVRLKLNPVAIVLTHAHFDHLLGILEVKLNFGVPILVHQNDLFLYERAAKSAQHWLGREIDPIPAPDGMLTADSFIEFGTQQLKIIETPGHTPGSICLLQKQSETTYSKERYLFSGDTLFRYAVGSTEHRYSSKSQLVKSLRTLLRLPSEIVVLPGHGEPTSIAAERTQLATLLE